MSRNLAGQDGMHTVSTWRRIAIPVAVTYAVMALRVVGELRHWRWCDVSTGFGGTLVGIAWLPVIFGPYFGWKLASADRRRSKSTRSLVALVAALVVFTLGVDRCTTGGHSTLIVVIGFLLTLVAAYILSVGWTGFGNTLLAYAFAVRIPLVLIVFVAMASHHGSGLLAHSPLAASAAPNWKAEFWGRFAMLPSLPVADFSHSQSWSGVYGLLGSSFAGQPFTFWQRFIKFDLVPQMTYWIGWTALLAGVPGTLAAIVHDIIHPPVPSLARRPAVKRAFQEPLFFKG